MVILGDLLDVLFDVTELNVWAYDNCRLQHKWIFGEDVTETIHQYRDRELGKLSIIDRKINVHNEPLRPGRTEIGWAVNMSQIPKEILKAQVTHILLSGRHGEGRELFVYVDMPAMDVEMVRAELAPIERPLEEVTWEEQT